MARACFVYVPHATEDDDLDGRGERMARQGLMRLFQPLKRRRPVEGRDEGE